MTVTGALAAPLRACAEGAEAPNLALMHLLSCASSEADAKCALEDSIARTPTGSDARRRLGQMASLWRERPSAYALVHRMHALANSDTDWRRTFDDATQLSPEAGVALYSLGDTNLLATATQELVELMRRWALLRHDSVVLDLGCGIGRVAAAIAPYVARVIALDVSPEMARLAAERTRHSDNISVVVGEGLNLAILADARFDLVLAIDCFPYLVASGVAAAHVAESARVLNAGGRLLVMNWSYRGDEARDARDIISLAEAHGFRFLRNESRPLSLWDGRAFLLAKK
ncbi:MAG TPA: class I SAM-dependent methyltransferase [Rhizomicrobium sp.]|jgi:SAM-dependent methyltransferase